MELRPRTQPADLDLLKELKRNWTEYVVTTRRCLKLAAG